MQIHFFYLNAAISLGNAFISLEISSFYLIFFSLFSFILAWTFISLQIKEFRIMGLSINNSVYSSLFFFLTGLHFFHLLLGLLPLVQILWSYSFSIIHQEVSKPPKWIWLLKRIDNFILSVIELSHGSEIKLSYNYSRMLSWERR